MSIQPPAPRPAFSPVFGLASSSASSPASSPDLSAVSASDTAAFSVSASAPAQAAALECRGLSKRYGQRQVLGRLDLSLAPGEYIAIMGDSGVGKSTLLNLIAGLDSSDSGSLHIAGVALSGLDDDAATLLRRQKLGFVFQAFHVLPHLTLGQNVALPMVLNGLPEPAAAASSMLAAVGLAGREHDFPRQLSGGELQRVAIARALVHKPKLILADEPTGNLDPDTALAILALLRAEIKANGASAILVTHSPAAAATADRVLKLTAQGLLPALPATGSGQPEHMSSDAVQGQAHPSRGKA